MTFRIFVLIKVKNIKVVPPFLKALVNESFFAWFVRKGFLVLKNMEKRNKIIGLIGGMGPFASAYFYKLLLKKSLDNYGSKSNEDFPEILVDSVPVPDFISNINELNRAKEMLVDRVSRLNTYGVNSISMICNTGHILYSDLVQISKVNFESIINVVANEASRRRYKRVGILATPTTIRYDLYGIELSKYNIEVVYSNDDIQKLHELVIRDMVAGKRDNRKIANLEIETKRLIRNNNLDGIILACTELPLIFPKNKFKNVIDCMDTLADKLLERYYN